MTPAESNIYVLLCSTPLELKNRTKRYLSTNSQLLTEFNPRLAFLFELYEKYATDLFTKEKVKTSKK